MNDMKKSILKRGLLALSVLIPFTVFGAIISDNTLRVGDKTGSDVEIQAGNGVIKWDNSGSALQFSTNGGSSYTEFGTTTAVAVTSKTAAYTAALADDTILVSATEDWTLSLPTAVGNEGKIYHIKRTDEEDGFAVTLDPDGSETIDGESTLPLELEGQFVRIVSDNANWVVISRSDLKKRKVNLLTSTVNTDTTVSDFTYNSLIVGRWYTVILSATFRFTGVDSLAEVQVTHDGSVIGSASAGSQTSGEIHRSTAIINFQAAATSLTFATSSFSNAELYTEGGGAPRFSRVELIEHTENVNAFQTVSGL